MSQNKPAKTEVKAPDSVVVYRLLIDSASINYSYQIFKEKFAASKTLSDQVLFDQAWKRLTQNNDQVKVAVQGQQQPAVKPKEVEKTKK